MKRLGILAVLVTAACTSTETGKPSGATALTADATRIISPSFSSDGSKVAYWEIEGAGVGWQLWVADGDFKNARKLDVTSVLQGAPICWSTDGARLIVASSAKNISDIVMVSLADGAVTTVLGTSRLEVPVGWHPDGDRVAYFEPTPSGAFTTSVLTLSTGRSAPLIPSEKRPVFALWSPDGTKVAYQVTDQGKNTIWIADGNGSNSKQLTSEGYEVSPSGVLGNFWSPDSKSVVYESRRTGTSDIWIVATDGSAPRQLTRDLRNDIAPTFTSDSKWVVFISDRGKQTDVWAVPVQGGPEVRLTDDVVEEAAPLGRPGGNQILYMTAAVRSSVWTYTLADSTERRLTPDSLRIGYFNVAPDGKLVDYVVNRGGGIDELAVSNIDGTGWRSVVSGSGTIVSPVWSPDGKHWAFQSDRGGSPDIWVASAPGGGDLRQITNWPSSEVAQVWNADGTGLYFVSDKDTPVGDVWSVPVAGGAPKRITNVGSVGPLSSATGDKELFVGVISPRDGRLAMSRLMPDGKLKNVWDETNVYGVVSRKGGDSVIVGIDVPGGFQNRMVPLSGGKARNILNVNERPQWWTPDGSMLLYFLPPAGSQDMAILDMKTGASRRLTKTPDREDGAEITADGKTVVFRRGTTVQRMFGVDLSTIVKK